MINFTKKHRSELWFSIYSDNIVTSHKWKKVLSYNLNLDDGIWFETKNNNYLINRYDIKNLDEFQNFIDHINNFVWLGLNKYIGGYFDSDILDYCVACDFNFDHCYNRTKIGEAEFLLKYRRNEMTDDEAKSYGNILLDAIKNCYDILPIDKNNVCFTTIPIDVNDNENYKLSYKLLSNLCSKIGSKNIYFIKCCKSSCKDKNLSEKINIWNNIYSDYSRLQFIENYDINNKYVVIIDDLYQSGASMWSYAKFLKGQGAKEVLGISAVKSLKDSDNKNV